MQKVSIIIVNWNTGKLLAQCVQALLTLPERALIAGIFVVDNHSSDASLVELSTQLGRHPLLHVQALNDNIGFAAANNRGVVQADEQAEGESTHIFLLNPDTVMRPGALTTLVTILDQHPHVGIIGPKLLNPDGSLQASVRRFPTLAIFILWFLKLSRVVSKHKIWQRYMAIDSTATHSQTVDQVMGAAFLIRRQAWKAIGKLDEKFWVWFEEVDYCRRASQAGWEVRFCPEAEVVHIGGTSFNQLIGPRRVIPFLNSSLYYAHKHLGFSSFLLLLLLYPVAALLSLPSALFHLRTA